MFALEPGDEISAQSACPECAALGTLTQEELVEYRGQPEATERHLVQIERSGKHLLQRVNGILVESELGVGSTFSFRIPGQARRDERSTPTLATDRMTMRDAALPLSGLERESAP